jgi:hypothetical protein
MPQSQTIGALVAALAKARASFKPVIKDAANPFFKSKYADLAGILDAVVPALSSNGLAVYHTTDHASGALILVTTLAHSSGEFVTGEYPVVPVKNDPQGYGSAITYARRYALSAMLSVAAEDDDGEAASGRAQPPSKVASVSGIAQKKKPDWTKEQQSEVGSLFAEIIRIGGDTGEAEIAKLRKDMGYDLPSDVIDAAGVLMRKWLDIENETKDP